MLRNAQNSKVATSYPKEFPRNAIEEILRIGKSGSWFQERSALGKAIWQFAGACQRIYLGDPDGEPIKMPDDPQRLAQKLHQCRDVLISIGRSAKTQTVTSSVGGDVLTSEDVHNCARMVEVTVQSGMAALAWSRKWALDNAKAAPVLA